MIGLDRKTLFEMTPREFLNAWEGFADNQKQQWNVLFYAAQYNAMRTAFSKDQQKQIRRDNPPWEKSKKKEPLDYDKMQGLFRAISKPAEA